MFRGQQYLHEVVGALHLCHEVLYSLSPNQGVCLSHSRERVRFRDRRRRRLCLLLHGIYNLTRDNNQLQFQLKAALHSSDLGVLAISGCCLTGYRWWNCCSGVEGQYSLYILHTGTGGQLLIWVFTALQSSHSALFSLYLLFSPWKKYLFNITWRFFSRIWGSNLSPFGNLKETGED